VVRGAGAGRHLGPHGIARWRQAARHRARIGTRPRAPLGGARPGRSVCALHLRACHARLLRAAHGLPATRGGRTVSTGVAGGGASGRRRR